MADLLVDQDRRLRYLFLDLNSYFASVEQQVEPSLRGVPTAVVPVMADSSFVIAASYEAKAFGVKTGTRIGDAKRMCPGLTLVMARHTLYVHYHELVKEVAEDVLPIDEVCSVDEMRFRLLGVEREPENARKIAAQMKAALAKHVGEYVKCSIGIAGNGFLAKVASDMQKPDGLVVLTVDQLHRLRELGLTEFAGINKRMAARLQGAGILDTNRLLDASESELRHAFGSVIGARWYYLLRGYDLPSEKTHRRSLGHSHVLAPDLRNEPGVRQVMLRLIQKATARLRAESLYATEAIFTVKGIEKSWEVSVRLPNTQDTLRVNQAFIDVWDTRDYVMPRGVAVTFTGLRELQQVTPSLFEVQQDRGGLNRAIDTINRKYGKNTIYIAAMDNAKDSADEKIAFNKTWLFSEGKGDNEMVKIARKSSEVED